LLVVYIVVLIMHGHTNINLQNLLIRHKIDFPELKSLKYFVLAR